MKGFLLDTNILSELRQRAPARQVRDFISLQPEDALFVSEVTFAEIRFGIERLGDAGRRAELRAWLDGSLRPYFAGRTLAVGEDVLLRWRLLLEDGRRRGHTFSQLDLIIAATAAEANLVVVSRDTTHFIAAGAPILNPWSGLYVGADGLEAVIDLTRSDVLARIDRQ